MTFQMITAAAKTETQTELDAMTRKLSTADLAYRRGGKALYPAYMATMKAQRAMDVRMKFRAYVMGGRTDSCFRCLASLGSDLMVGHSKRCDIPAAFATA